MNLPFLYQREVDALRLLEGQIDEAIGPAGLDAGKWRRLLQPVFADRAHLLQIVEQVGVQDLFSIRAIEAFDEGILCRFPRLDV